MTCDLVARFSRCLCGDRENGRGETADLLHLRPSTTRGRDLSQDPLQRRFPSSAPSVCAPLPSWAPQPALVRVEVRHGTEPMCFEDAPQSGAARSRRDFKAQRGGPTMDRYQTWVQATFASLSPRDMGDAKWFFRCSGKSGLVRAFRKATKYRIMNE